MREGGRGREVGGVKLSVRNVRYRYYTPDTTVTTVMLMTAEKDSVNTE